MLIQTLTNTHYSAYDYRKELAKIKQHIPISCCLLYQKFDKLFH
jgi:hypothetical protein